MSIDTSKIIHAPVGGGRYTVTAPIVKEDYGLYLLIEGLELPSTYEVDFSNSEHNGTSVTMIGNADGVLIPSQFISSGKDVFAFLYHVGVDFGRTVYKFRIPNKLRPDRTEETPTPTQQSVIDQAISALNSAVAQTAQDVIDADESAQESAESARASANSAVQASLSESNAERAKGNAQASAESASASATASAQSAEQSAINSADAQDSAEDAQGYAQASTQSATASANSASQASGYAQSASASASSAQGYASQAQTSAQTASTKASEASQSASTASQKATEASQSATNAQGYAQTAEQAKTASQTAQGLAESARDSAISAKDDAEDARDEAQNIVDGISGKVEQIDQNTADIASLEDDRFKPYAVDTASGAVASFTDGADDIPLKSLVVDINPVQEGTGDPSPDNVRPISGWTGMNIQYIGKNLFDPNEYLLSGATKVEGADAKGHSDVYTGKKKDFYRLHGSVKTDPSATGLIPRLPYGRLTISFYKFIENNDQVWFHYTDADAWVNHTGNTSAIGHKTYTSDANRVCDGVALETTQGATATYKFGDLQIEVASAETEYKSYNGTTIPISWQTEAGTVYGGKLDVVNGLLRVTRAYRKVTTSNTSVKTGSASEAGYAYPYGRYMRTTLNGVKIPISTTYTLCDSVKYTTLNDFESGAIGWCRPSNSQDIIYWKTPDCATEEGANALRSADIYFSYLLATPVEIQLDAHTLNSFYGANNLWADTGDTACEYRADTTLYIQRLTEPDTDMIADSNITSGKYFMVGNNLYLATANIASGGQVIVGTNCTRKSLSEALNEINA